MFLQTALSGPKINCSGGYTVPHGHFFGGEQAPSSQSAITALQIERLANVRNLFQVERLMLPSPSSPLIQNFRNLAIAIVIQQCIDLGDYLGFRLPNLSNRQRFGQSEASRGATSETHMDLDYISTNQRHILNE